MIIAVIPLELMESEQQIEWSMLRDRAIEHLRDFGHVKRSKYRPVAQFLILPSFSATRSVDLLERDNLLVAFHSIWKSTTDMNAFATPIERMKHPRIFMPTYESLELDVNPANLQNLLSTIGSVELKLTPTTNTICVDGTSYELYVGPGYTGIRLRWHHELPDEWNTLMPIRDTFLEWEQSSCLIAG